MDERIEVKNWQEMLAILDELGVSRECRYSSHGVEIYDDYEKQIQVVYNQRNNNNYLLIHKGW